MSREGTGRAVAVAIALACGALPVQAQTPTAPAPANNQSGPVTAEAFHAEIGRLYGFAPNSLKKQKRIEATSARLDAFWNKVKADKATYLPLLRAELVRADNPPFFYFDGAELLRDASDSREDGQLALNSIERADLTNVDPSGYLYALNWFVNHGYDTRRAALRWMDKPNEQIIAQPFPHVFYYRPLQALIFSLFGMDEELFVGDLVARLQTARDDHEISALIHAIWATATAEGRAALAAYAEDPARKPEARKYAGEMLLHQGEGPLPTRSEAELRQDRRDVIANPFQHGSFERFHAITDQLVRIAGQPAQPR